MKREVFYPNLRAELARIGASFADIANYMGMTRQNVQNKFAGPTSVNERDMKKIQEFFIANGGGAMTLDYLFKKTK